VNLTTRQKADAALTVACPVHGDPAGQPCTLPGGVMAGSCLDRREVALGCRDAELEGASR